MNWDRVSIGTVAKVISGFAFKSASFQTAGKIPVIKIANIRRGYVDLSDSIYVDESFQSIDSRFHVSNGDILISLTGSHITLPNSVVGRVAKYQHSITSLLNQRAGKFLIKREVADSNFLYYALSLQETLERIASFAQGAANQANISPSNVESVFINLPPLPTQQRIAAILSAYDDLIENNLRRIQLLEEAARCEYKMMIEEIEAQESIKLSDVYNTSSGGTPSRSKPEYYIGDIRWFKTKELEDSILIDSEEMINEKAIENSSAKVFPKGSVLLAMYGATIGKVGILTKEAASNQACCAIIPKSNEYSSYFIYQFLLENKEYVLSFRMGAAQENISQTIVRNLNIPKIADAVLEEYNTVVTPLFKMITNLQVQNIQLRQARDILLPKLMNGEIEV